MKSDGALILAVLFLAAGLAVIFSWGVGTGSFNAAYPFAAANLQLSISTSGPAAIGGLLLTVLGALLMVWAVIGAVAGQLLVFGAGGGRAARLERRRLDHEERLLEREERLKASNSKI